MDELRYPARPSGLVIERFLQHVRETGQPETFPSIDTSKPPRDADMVFLKRFPINRARRPDLDMVPCPICSPNSPKYLDGILAWYPAEGVIRAIGHECGDSYFEGDRHRDAARQYQEEQQRIAAEDFLLENVSKVPIMRRAVAALMPAANEARQLHCHFRRRALDIHKCLRRIWHEADGRLEVGIETEMSGEGPRGIQTSTGGGRSYSVEQFGSLAGSEMLLCNYNPVKELWNVDSLLRDTDFGEGDSAQEKICEISPESLNCHVNNIRSAERSFKNAFDRLNNFRNFFSVRQFDALNKWGQHPKNLFSLKASTNKGRFSLYHDADNFVTFTPLFKKLDIRSEWPQ